MNATTAAIDLAKNVFQVALADANARVLEQHRLTRAQFERFSTIAKWPASCWRLAARHITGRGCSLLAASR